MSNPRPEIIASVEVARTGRLARLDLSDLRREYAALTDECARAVMLTGLDLDDVEFVPEVLCVTDGHSAWAPVRWLANRERHLEDLRRTLADRALDEVEVESLRIVAVRTPPPAPSA
ncbi:MAG: hypothetical protein FLDDKLPJ_00915 [Phycisphaerae bacterium]|nr:hypothetical protein [Phycisphaerae bacterium]